MQTKEEFLQYLYKISKILKPFYDFERTNYKLDNKKELISLISCFYIGGIFLVIFFFRGAEASLCGLISCVLLIIGIRSFRAYNQKKRKNIELEELRKRELLKLQSLYQDYKKYKEKFPSEFYNYPDICKLYNLIKTQQADSLKEAFQVLRNQKFQQQQNQKLQRIQQQNIEIQRNQKWMQKDINNLKRR